jgi:Flp pilus assembly protein TadD/SAM-dependent methyltransferase
LAPDLRSILAQAVEHHQAGQLDAAIACYRQALAFDPDLASAHYNLGNALCALGKLEEAEASYRRVLALKPNLAVAHNNLGALLLGQDRLDEAVACHRAALALQPDYAEAFGNLGAALCRQGALEEGEAAIRHALALKPDFTMALDNLAVLLKNQGRWDEAIAVFRRLLQIRPDDIEVLNGLASALAARGDAVGALEAIHRSLRLRETASARRIFVDIVKPINWTGDNREVRHFMARALAEPWARPGELAGTAASLIKQDARIGAWVKRAVQDWPRSLAAADLFGPDGAHPFSGDALLLALLTSAQNTDIELERFLTLGRRVLLKAAEDNDAADAGLVFYAALVRQCFINEYVHFQDDEEFRRVSAMRDAVTVSLETGAEIAALQLLAVAAYFPLHALSGAARLLDRSWPEPISAVLLQQVREPQMEAALRAALPSLTPIEDATSRLVQSQYEENPYPRWVRMPPVEKASSITLYLRQKFPLAPFQPAPDRDVAEFLSAGCGTGQMALELAQGFAAHVRAVDLSLASLGYAKRKALEFGLTRIEFAQADILELGATDRRFDLIECSGVLHHMSDPFAGWRSLLSLLNPGGFMLVALYSEKARRGVVEAQRYIAEGGYSPSSDDIRRCRQDLLDMDPERTVGTDFGDFFGTSSCRDLLFHVQEQRTSIPAIAAFLDDNALTFLGFETDRATLEAYKRRFPGDPAATDLKNWEAFENDKPDTFARMYVFWVQKQPG